MNKSVVKNWIHYTVLYNIINEQKQKSWIKIWIKKLTKIENDYK
jgi:hypothetical protein